MRFAAAKPLSVQSFEFWGASKLVVHTYSKVPFNLTIKTVS
jgi:hypothetical protein